MQISYLPITFALPRNGAGGRKRIKMNSNSKRNYELVIHESVDGFHKVKISIDEVMFPKEKNAFEYIYALQEIVDKVLDLPSGHAMYFKPNRDNESAFVIIARID